MIKWKTKQTPFHNKEIFINTILQFFALENVMFIL